MINWDYDLATGQIDIEAHTGLLLAEDAALKQYLLGITIPERGGMTPVDVWFRYPEGERRIKFPFITIDFLAINPSYDRWTSQHHVPEDYASFEDPITGQELRTGMYIPSTSSSLPDKGSSTAGYDIEPYLMYTLTYQVSVHSRSALHDRYLSSLFMTDIFPPRPFWIGVDADSTWRRCELREMQPADTMETTESGNKRIFRKIYTISMDAEIPQSRIYEVEKVQRLHIDLYRDLPVEKRELYTHMYNNTHNYAEPITVEPPSGS
jgi:hypothetical protein